MKFVLLSLWLACLTFDVIAHSLLLVVGDVTASTARILYDALDPSLIGQPLLTKLIKVGGVEPDHHHHITLTERPKVIILRDLLPETQYMVHFGEGVLASPESVSFQTFPAIGASNEMRILAVSCDRWLEDRDDSGWQQLLEMEDGRYHGIVHLGDQIYADQLFLNVSQDVTFESALITFRSYYRQQWGRPIMQRVLRQGAHWMLPDDHDVLNNFNWYHLAGCRNAACSHQETNRAVLVRAGIQALQEYQLQLNGDVDWEQPASAFFARTLGSTGLLFLDTRFDRVLSGSANATILVSSGQLSAVKTQQEEWEQNPGINTILAFSSMPLLLHTTWAAEIPYQFEGEFYGGHRHVQSQTIALLQLLVQSNKTKMLTSGDVHFFAQGKACHGSRCITLLVTSGITAMSTSIKEFKLFIFHLFVTRMTSQRLGAWHWKFTELFFGRNYGWIQVGAKGDLMSGCVLGQLDSTVQVMGQFVVTHFYSILMAIAVVTLFSTFLKL